MSQVLDTITSTSDDAKLCVLYQKLFKELQVMDNTLQENQFIEPNIDQILQILTRDTDYENNDDHISSNTLNHIIPVVGFILNLSESTTNISSCQYFKYIKKLYFNILNIIRGTTDLELCIRCLWMFKSIHFNINNEIQSFLALYYESTYQFLFDDTNRFLSSSTKKINKDRIYLLRSLILESYINLFFNNKQYEIFINKSKYWLHGIVTYLIIDHKELLNSTIIFLTKFINHIKTMDNYDSIKYNYFHKIFTSDKSLRKSLEKIIKKKDDNEMETIYKWKIKKNNNTNDKQLRNLKIWSIIIHLLNSNMRNDQKLINRSLQYLQSYFSTNPVEAFKYFKDLIFVFNLNSKHIWQKKTLSLFYKVFDNAFNQNKNKGKRSINTQIQCIKTWFYAISVLCKHGVLFKKDDKGHCPFKIIVVPLLNLIKNSNIDDIITHSIIKMMTNLLFIDNESDQENLLNTPPQNDHNENKNNADILQSENGQKSSSSILLPNAIKNIGISSNQSINDDNDIIKIDECIKNYKYKFGDWLISMDYILKFNTDINKKFCNDLSTNCILIFLQTFFKSISMKNELQNQQTQQKIFEKYLEKLTVFIVMIGTVLCDKNRTKNKELQWKNIENMGCLIECYFKNIVKYWDNLQKCKLQKLYNGAFGVKLGDYNKNILMFLMKFWLNKCQQFDLFPFCQIYNEYIESLKKIMEWNRNNEDTERNIEDMMICIEIYDKLTKEMLLKMNKLKKVQLKQNKDVRNLCCCLNNLFYQIFNDLIKTEEIEEIINTDDDDQQQQFLLIIKNIIQSLFKFIAVFDLKFNENNNAIFKSQWFDETEKKLLTKNFVALLRHSRNIICKLLNGKYNDEHHEYVVNKKGTFLSKPILNEFITNIHQSLSDKNHELIFMKWCKYKQYKNDDENKIFLHENMSLILIKSGQLLLQCLYKSNQNWFHNIDNKQLFQLITSIFLYIIHRCNNINSVSQTWLKYAKYFIKSFNKFLSKLSMTEYVNIWSHSISNRLLWYIKHYAIAPALTSMLSLDSDNNDNDDDGNNDDDNNNNKQLLFNSISTCFQTYINITSNYSSVDTLIDKVLHKTRSSTKKKRDDNLQIQFIQLLHCIMKLNDKNKQIWKVLNNCIDLKMKTIIKFMINTMKIKFDSKSIKKEYPLFIKLYTKYNKQKENDILTLKKEVKQSISASPDCQQEENKVDIKNKKRERLLYGDSKSLSKKPIIKKSSRKTSMVSTRSRRRAKKKREFIDLDDSQHPVLTFSETQMSFDIFDEQFDDDNDTLNEQDANKDNNENIKDPMDLDDDIVIDVDMKEKEKEDEKGKAKSISAEFDFNPSDMVLQQEFDIIESSDKEKSKSKSLSLDIKNDLKNGNGSSIIRSRLPSTMKSSDNILSGKKRKLNDINGKDNGPKSKKMKISGLCTENDNDKELFFPSLIGYKANINNLLNMLPRKIRLLIQKTPFKTIDELAKCEKNVVIKYLIEAKTRNKNGNIEYELKEIKNTLQTLVIVYEKEKKKNINKNIVQHDLTEMSTTTPNDSSQENKNKNQNKNSNDLDAKNEEMQLKLTKILSEFEHHKNDWNLEQITRIHQIIGRFNNNCIESTANELNKRK